MCATVCICTSVYMSIHRQLNHFAMYPKLTQYCNQIYFNYKKEKKSKGKVKW